MANPDCGRITCPFCKGEAAVRRYKGSDRGKLYFSCGTCGIIRPNLAKGQAWIEANAVFGLPATPAPTPALSPAAGPPSVAAAAGGNATKEPKPAEKPRSALSSFLADL